MLKEIKSDEGAISLVVAIVKSAAKDLREGYGRNRESAERFFKEDPYGLFDKFSYEDIHFEDEA